MIVGNRNASINDEIMVAIIAINSINVYFFKKNNIELFLSLKICFKSLLVNIIEYILNNRITNIFRSCPNKRYIIVSIMPFNLYNIINDDSENPITNPLR